MEKEKKTKGVAYGHVPVGFSGKRVAFWVKRVHSQLCAVGPPLSGFNIISRGIGGQWGFNRSKWTNVIHPNHSLSTLILLTLISFSLSLSFSFSVSFAFSFLSCYARPSTNDVSLFLAFSALVPPIEPSAKRFSTARRRVFWNIGQSGLFPACGMCIGTLFPASRSIGWPLSYTRSHLSVCPWC